MLARAAVSQSRPSGAPGLEQGDVEATIEDFSLTLGSCDIDSPVFTLGIEWCLFWVL